MRDVVQWQDSRPASRTCEFDSRHPPGSRAHPRTSSLSDQPVYVCSYAAQAYTLLNAAWDRVRIRHAVFKWLSAEQNERTWFPRTSSLSDQPGTNERSHQPVYVCSFGTRVHARILVLYVRINPTSNAYSLFLATPGPRLLMTHAGSTLFMRVRLSPSARCPTRPPKRP